MEQAKLKNSVSEAIIIAKVKYDIFRRIKSQINNNFSDEQIMEEINHIGTDEFEQMYGNIYYNKITSLINQVVRRLKRKFDF